MVDLNESPCRKCINETGKNWRDKCISRRSCEKLKAYNEVAMFHIPSHSASVPNDPVGYQVIF